jgi:hypothetical protein
MKNPILAVLAALAAAGAAAAGAEPSSMSAESRRAMVEGYCVMCHSDESRTGGLTLESFDVGRPETDPEIAERIIRKLRAGMMPPSFASRPEPSEIAAFASSLEAILDEIYFKDPEPGRRSFQRLNRAEYARSIQDLLAIELDVDALLPPDTISHSFDNIADVQVMSPTLMDSYLRAADHVSRMAVGDREALPNEVTYKVPRTASQLRHVEGAPMGTRGGISVTHNFPADGEYVFRVELQPSPEGFLFGTSPEEQIEISLNGARVELLSIDPLMSETDPDGLNIRTAPITVKAGPHRVSAAFLKKSEGVIEDVMAPIEHTLADSQIGVDFGITTAPHLRDLGISGPYRVTGVSDTPARRRIFLCRPTSPEEELACAERIVEALATRAYRRPLDDSDLEGLMSFYVKGREEGALSPSGARAERKPRGWGPTALRGDFESGIRMALQAILTSPSFLFRLEDTPPAHEPGGRYPISDVALASRLSFFLWSAPPDEERLKLASEGKLSDPEELRRQVLRMLKDPRASTLATRFASLWLRLQDLDKIHPDAIAFPQYDATLASAMKRETELFFDNLVREDRSALEILTGDYTFVNERLAKHYRVPNVTGNHFRRVSLDGTNQNRRGVLGHGSILTLTSIANRTSPVQRGKWVLEVLLGTPPPPPPPNVPALEETKAVAFDRVLSVRERMEEHRSNPACTSCHAVIDPIGLALENFDVTGAWRIKDGGTEIDASGELYDGTPLDGPLGLRDAILGRSEAFLRTFTESLMTYALGRRVEYFDMPAIRKVVRDAEVNDSRMSSFILGVVESTPFRMSRLGRGTTSTTEGH